MADDGENHEDNVVLAFGLVIAAGLSTTLGAAVVFLLRGLRKQVLAIFLSLSGGVMMYISLVEIFATKSRQEFESTSAGEQYGHVYATLCFFGGVLTCILIEKIAHFVGSHSDEDVPMESYENMQLDVESQGFEELSKFPGENVLSSPTPIPSESPNLSLDMNRESQSPGKRGAETPGDEEEHPHDAQLLHMGLMTALAIGIHNFPEGLATFVAALADESLGFAMATAIALHNIPEGVCVSLPVYYATKSKTKAFMWAFISGITEPIGALLGWLALKDVFEPTVYGILFGSVAGMMVYISMKELMPAAYRYDPTDKWATTCFFIGAAVMALSLILFAL